MIADILETQKKFFSSDEKSTYDIFKIEDIIKRKKYTENFYRTVNHFHTPLFNTKDADILLNRSLPLPILEFIKNNEVAIAGGIFSTTQFHATKYHFGNTDIDIFILGINYNSIIDELISVIAKCSKHTLKLIYNKHCITIMREENPIQIVLRSYTSISEILHGFDLGSSCIAFDGTDYWTTSMGQFAYEYGFNIIDMSLRSTTYEKRLVKYFHRGFGFIMPKLKLEVDSFRSIQLGFMKIENYTPKFPEICNPYFDLLYQRRVITYSTFPCTLVMLINPTDTYSRDNWKLHATAHDIRRHPKIQEKKLNALDEAREVKQTCVFLHSKELYELNIFGYAMITSEPTTQKFGMFDPSETTEAEWYGDNYKL